MKLLLAMLLLTSCGGQGNYKEITDYQKVAMENGWEINQRTNIVKISKTYQLKEGEILDGKGKLYLWTGEHQEWCHSHTEKSETAPRMFQMAKHSKIMNMDVECSLDGIEMEDDTEIRNVTFRDAEEDAISTKGTNNRIINNKFFLAQDKAIQLNNAENVLIKGNTFHHSGRAVSGSGKNAGGARGVKVIGNRMKNVEIAIRAQRNHEIFAKDNVIEQGRSMFESVEQSEVHDCGGNTATGGAEMVSKKSVNAIKKDSSKCKGI